MAGSTANRNYPYPTASDANDVPYAMQTALEDVDLDVASLVTKTTPSRSIYNGPVNYGTANGVRTVGTLVRDAAKSSGVDPVTANVATLTIKTAGVYAVTLRCRFSAGLETGSTIFIQSGAGIEWSSQMTGLANGSVSFTEPLIAGQTLSFGLYRPTGTTINQTSIVSVVRLGD